jgi:hypothetical protein
MEFAATDDPDWGIGRLLRHESRSLLQVEASQFRGAHPEKAAC